MLNLHNTRNIKICEAKMNQFFKIDKSAIIITDYNVFPFVTNRANQKTKIKI